MVAEDFEFVVGVDTHRDTHTATILNAAGAVVGSLTAVARDCGYRTLLDLAIAKAPGRRVWAVEGTRSYGLGLSRYLQTVGETVVEIEVPKQSARKRGKSDTVDAERAAREAWARQRLATPRADGEREALRILMVARRQLVDWRVQATSQIENLVLGLPDELRSGFGYAGSHRWEHVLKASSQLTSSYAADIELTVRIGTIGDLAARAWELEKAAALYLHQIQALVGRLAPQLLAEPGVGPITAAQVLLVWSHQGRLHSEAAFARIGAAAPLPASSGTVTRHRLSRLGDRQLNSALTTIVQSRRRWHQETRDYVARRSQDHMNDREINRCLKRYVARRLYKLLEHGRTNVWA
jgi:transposase